MAKFIESQRPAPAIALLILRNALDGHRGRETDAPKEFSVPFTSYSVGNDDRASDFPARLER